MTKTIKRIRFLWQNEIDTATITASSEAAGFPVSNLQDRWHTRPWRTTGLADEWAKFDLLEEKDIQAIVIKEHNFQAGASVRIHAYSDAWITLAYLKTLPITSGQIVKLWRIPLTYRWWMLAIKDPGNPDGYSRIGRPFLGGYFRPSYDISRPPKIIPVDPSIVMASSGGQKSSDQREHYQKISFEFDMIPESDKTIFESIFAQVGKSKPYFICRNQDDPTNTTYYVQNLSDFDFDPRITGWHSLKIDTETMR